MMNINSLAIDGLNAVEVVSKDIFIKNPQDALDLMAETSADALVLYTHNFEDDFFDLSTKKLGEILQKFTNYRVKLAIVGDFSKYPSEILPQFIYESNRAGQYLFVPTLNEVLERWSK